MTSPANRRVGLWWGISVALTVAKLWLTRGQPVFALSLASHDDRLFVQLADHILHGRWLGPYDQMTLAKGPFYSLWIAAAHWLHVPLFLSQQIFYAAACAALVWACAPAIRSAGVRTALYLFMLVNPITLEASSLGRVLRQHVYSPLMLLIFAGLIALYLRRDQPLRRLAPWAAVLGFAFGGFWLTREESVWIMPGVALLIAAIAIGAWRASRAALQQSAIALALAAVCASLPVLGVSAMNYRYYGWFGTVEFRDAAFNDAYGAMVRVRVGTELPFVPVTREARAAMYAVSPTFAKLQPYFDGPIGQGWAEASSSVTGLPPAQKEIGGGWLMWALRDVTATAGYCHSAREALDFYRRMSDEINRACDSGRLPAGPHRSGFLPRWNAGDEEKVLFTTLSFADFVVSYQDFSAISPPSSGDDESLEFFRKVTREHLSSPDTAPPATPDARAVFLDRLGRTTAHIFHLLFLAAQVVVVFRAWQVITARDLTFPFVLAAATWGSGLAYLTIQAIIQVTSFNVMVISSFAPVYPLLPLFVIAVGWDAVIAWRTRQSRVAAPTSVSHNESGSMIPAVTLSPKISRLLPWLAAIVALLPPLIWHRHFAALFWFGDDYFLIDQLAQMGFWNWTWVPFTESFVPLFKALWGGAVEISGSYTTMLALLWFTHAVNVLLFGRLLLRCGFPWFSAVATQIVFGLSVANLETLGWSVQWSAVLATTFLLCALLAGESSSPRKWLTHGLVVLSIAASACSFARGVLSGAVLALSQVWPAWQRRDWRELMRQLPLALLYVAPAIAVIVIIETHSLGNHRQMAGHWLQAIGFGATFFLANPGYLLFGSPSSNTLVSVALLGAVKLALLAWGLRSTSGRMRNLLVLLVAYDLGNAVLLGIGRYHTGFFGAVNSRYYYGSLLSTLPFAALWLESILRRLPAIGKWRTIGAAAAIAGLLAWCLAGWPKELASFTPWRGTDMRQLMAAPTVADPNVRLPGLDIMHVERAKAVIRAYDLH